MGCRRVEGIPQIKSGTIDKDEVEGGSRTISFSKDTLLETLYAQTRPASRKQKIAEATARRFGTLQQAHLISLFVRVWVKA